MGYYDPNQFYFGTVGRMQMIPAPLRGMDNSPLGWSDSGTYLNGGGWARRSFDSHKNYSMEWRSSSAPRVAEMMHSYASGSFGRGLIYFVDPTIYLHNTLPARWADPSLALNYEGRSLVYGVTPTGVPTASPETLGLPSQSALYDLSQTIHNYRGDDETVFVPIPPGMALLLGAIYTSSSANAGVYWNPVGSTGATGLTPTRVTPSDTITPGLFMGSPISGVPGVRVWVGKTTPTAETVTLTALTTRLVPISWVDDLSGFGLVPFGGGPFGGISNPQLLVASMGPWVGGMGHSGCRFVTAPSLSTTTSQFGGRMGFSASFTEVGDWYYG